ncbi:hypothetical protein RMATCC62417_16288 [Rhizopus microsporus]|nr:hypothetical protein RMATCC62417_16288 [Rhizopus microsporus]
MDYILHSWEKVKPIPVSNCFRHTTLLEPLDSVRTQSEVEQLEEETASEKQTLEMEMKRLFSYIHPEINADEIDLFNYEDAQTHEDTAAFLEGT